MKLQIKLSLALALFSAIAPGCADSQQPTEEEVPVEAKCTGASGELGQLSCLQNEPVNADGLTRAEVNPAPAQSKGDEVSIAAPRTYTGGCTGIWYGCSRVNAEGWTYESCGTSHYVYMTFDGAHGNLISWGIGYCWF